MSSPAAILHSGLLLKKSKWLREWRPRAFALTASGELVYSQPAGPELGRVALRGASVTAPSGWLSSARDLEVRPAEGASLQLRAADADDRDTWVRHLVQAQVTGVLTCVIVCFANLTCKIFPHFEHSEGIAGVTRRRRTK